MRARAQLFFFFVSFLYISPLPTTPVYNKIAGCWVQREMKEPIHAHRERGNERIYKGTNTHRQKNTVDYVWKLKGEGSGVLLLALSLSNYI